MVLRPSIHGKFYGCSRWPKCKGTHSAYADGRPMGVPGNAATKQARHRAHGVLDQLCLEWEIDTEEAYRIVCREMRMSRDEAHMGRFSKEQCEELIGKLEYLMASAKKDKAKGHAAAQ